MMQTRLSFPAKIIAAFILTTVMYCTSAKAQSAPRPAANNLILPPGAYSISFCWQGDSVAGKWEPHTAILIPVKLKGCPKQLYMQFDTGSPNSLFYRNKLAAVQAAYPQAIQLSETDNKLTNFSFRAGKMPISAKQITVKQFDSSGINWKDKKSIEVIGTLGTDLIDGKVAVIDYPGRKLTISGSMPAKAAGSLSLTDFIYAARRILLPAKVQGKETILYFDSGSSMYELLTDKKTCETLAAPGGEFIQSKVWSWGKYLTANSIASNAGVEIAGISLPVHYATYIEGVSGAQVEQMKKMGIGGMTGNKIFADCTLVLDTKNKKFGIIPR